MEIGNVSAVVTGGASGLGAATARALAEGGARVAVLDINADGVAAVAKEIDGIGLTCDVTDGPGAEAALAEVSTPSARRAFWSTAPASGWRNASSGATGRCPWRTTSGSSRST